MNESFSSNDFDSLDTRSFRKGALATIRSTSALDKTVKSCYLVLSQKQYESPRVRRKYRLDKQPSNLEQTSNSMHHSSILDDSINNLHLTSSSLAELAALSQKQQAFPLARCNDVSASVIKEAMIKRLREHDSLKRQYVKGEMAFTDSIASLSDDANRQHNSSYAGQTHNSKLSSLVSSKEDYAFKWQKMREMRTKRRLEKEVLEQQRSSASLFRNIVKHMEK
ncbi:hypothetical protein EON65_15405 [archaeon]|nr:MAG: hypothetical protein EON65_15405 [archaeon]